MPGKFVFPGGRIEPADRAHVGGDANCSHATPEQAHDTGKDPSADLPRGLALAAVRETYEETGLLLGVKRDQPPRRAGRHRADFAKAERSSRPRAISISSPAPSRRRSGRAASTPASSPPISPPLHTRSKALSAPIPNWSNWSGCPSPRRPSSTCRPLPAWCLRNCRPRRRRHGPRIAGAVLPYVTNQHSCGNCCRNPRLS